jgi:hypothetical protein
VQDLFTVDRDVYAIPNRVVVVGVTDGENTERMRAELL